MVNELKIEAKKENFEKVLAFVDEALEKAGVPYEVQLSVEMAIEEIYLNIVYYAYAQKDGDATILTDINEKDRILTLTFIDEGPEYNPLLKEDPDTTMDIMDRPIGGLGILMVKKMMDDVAYCRENGENHLTIKKGW
ncbi:MAG TPA: ATP-binding protein [Lachnospiraceae bacterium]|nr:ATP-binding protein [Lachnospiraceae bacterium]